MMTRVERAVVVLAALLIPVPLTGQTVAPARIHAARPDPVMVRPVYLDITAASAVPRTAGGAFLVESLGGAVGSAAGVLLGATLADRCDSENLTCNLRRAGVAGLVGTAGAVAGAYAVGRWQRTGPSLLGAVLGSVAGAAAGIGVTHLLTEELNAVHSDTAVLVAFSITQGVVTALGSRLLSR